MRQKTDALYDHDKGLFFALSSHFILYVNCHFIHLFGCEGK